MLRIKRKVNITKDYFKSNRDIGIKIDLRTLNHRIVVSYAPWNNKSEVFKNWISKYSHIRLIIKIKVEGLKDSAENVSDQYRLTHYFFLEQSVFYVRKSLSKSKFKTLMRFSELESIQLETVYLSYVPSWIWIDDFKATWQNLDFLNKLNMNGIKTCRVSPELQGWDLYSKAKKINRHFGFFSPTDICIKHSKFLGRK
jgi:hypothetical protein